MPSDPSKAGKIGGARNTPAQQAARRKNGFQPTPKTQTEIMNALAQQVHRAANRKPTPTTEADEFAQEVPSDDMSI
jgi:3-mercaptopyruvate sulfurtransferase SseA